jgi:hypothetical protein
MYSDVEVNFESLIFIKIFDREQVCYLVEKFGFAKWFSDEPICSGR